MSTDTEPAIDVAVVIERIAQPNAWQDWTFRLVEVLPDESTFGTEPRLLHDDGKVSRWLHPGFRVQLFADECKGYFLNLTSGQPAWFVSWQVRADDPSQVEVTAVSVSYIEADRRMTAEEQVENLPLDAELCEWLRVFTNAHFRPDTGRKVRAMSFLSPEERERHAAAMTRPADDSASRNAALREMFLTDPHFRQSDGLDVRHEDEVQAEGSPRGRQRKIELARSLGLLDDELTEQDPPPADGGAKPT